MSPEHPTSAPPITLEQLRASLADWFAPWVQDLGLQVQGFGDGEVTLLLPQNARLSRIGGMVCGQALMAAADTAMVLAIVTRLGTSRPMTTVQLNTSFLKPLSNQDARVTARVIRAGKSLVFGKSTLAAPGMARACAAPAPLTPCSERPAGGPGGPVA